jgi:hypothetical protein
MILQIRVCGAEYDSVHRASTQCQGSLSYQPCQEIPRPLADSPQSILQALWATSAGQGGQSCKHTPTSLERTMKDVQKAGPQLGLDPAPATQFCWA